ncbi:uncharacterized protein LOC18425291 isoform X2 [Amborella trichopoda]|uniref:Uncharacterized protein n=1 Tax=Amborella trichopoda TaxID=13333 RepID=W1NRJ5_AMBTC|nr:uncharacterized protein LOC18425291 isoform X2 [Amborella trichopoda]ERM97334.1 hypothetical protein AMTR_s00073p00138100 [Amborella trichopoda]|eukprot:XP_006829918.1 uncharacterized protein LOC18425291 isoform X2 [Amborella trichopoda]
MTTIPQHLNLSKGDGQNPTPIAFFGVRVHNRGGEESDPGWNLWEPRKKKLKELDLIENSQISSIDFLQTHQVGAVSVGLGLSLNDKRLASSGDSTSSSSLLIDKEFCRELQRQEADINQFLKVQILTDARQGKARQSKLIPNWGRYKRNIVAQ